MSCRRHRGVSFRLAACVGVLICLAPAGPVAARSAKEAVKATGVEAGLAVHLGSTDGAVEVALTNGGKMLVHGLGDEPRRIFDEIARIKAVDVLLPTRSGVEIHRRCVTRPDTRRSCCNAWACISRPACPSRTRKRTRRSEDFGPF